MSDAVVPRSGNFDHLGFVGWHRTVNGSQQFALIEIQPPKEGFDPAAFRSTVEFNNHYTTVAWRD